MKATESGTSHPFKPNRHARVDRRLLSSVLAIFAVYVAGMVYYKTSEHTKDRMVGYVTGYVTKAWTSVVGEE